MDSQLPHRPSDLLDELITNCEDYDVQHAKGALTLVFFCVNLTSTLYAEIHVDVRTREVHLYKFNGLTKPTFSLQLTPDFQLIQPSTNNENGHEEKNSNSSIRNGQEARKEVSQEANSTETRHGTFSCPNILHTSEGDWNFGHSISIP